MPRQLTCLRVFLASPGGLADEREAFRNVVRQYSDEEAIPRGVLFLPVGWEDALSGVGRPQSLINEDVRTADYFILLLWDRWGTPPETNAMRYASGSEEEYHVALACRDAAEEPMRQLVMMFKAVDPRQLSDPGPQLQRVIQFRREIESQKTHLYCTFDTTESFRSAIRRHLAAWLRDVERGVAGQHLPFSEVLPDGIAGDLESPDQTPRDHARGLLTAEAWRMADEGRVTEAEIEFARVTGGTTHPDSLVQYAGFLLRVGRVEQAKVLLERAAAASTEVNDGEALARSRMNLGNVLGLQGDLDGAEKAYRESVEMQQELGLAESACPAYLNLADVLRARGHLDRAEEMYRASIVSAEELGLQERLAHAYLSLGNLYDARGDSPGADRMYHTALRINVDLGRKIGIANCYGSLGNMLVARGDLATAEEMYTKSLEIHEELRNMEGVANSQGNLGMVLLARGDLDGAETMFTRSLDIDEQLGGSMGVSRDLLSLGRVLEAKGDLGGAEEMYRKSLATSERSGHVEDASKAYLSLGNVHQAQGDSVGAEQMYRTSRELAQTLGASRLERRADSRMRNHRP